MGARTNATDLILFRYVGHTELGDLPVKVNTYVGENGDLWLDTDSPHVLDQETVNQAVRRSRVAMHRDITATCPPPHRMKEN